MTPYFSDPESRFHLEAELEEWKGTRFNMAAAGRAVKGVGADCVSFVAAVLENVGAIQPFVWPPYVVFGGGATMLNRCKDTLDTIHGLQCVWTAPEDMPELIPGDVLVRSLRADYHHLAIFAGDNTVWHSLRRAGVCTANLQDPIVVNNLCWIYRAYEPAK